MNDLRRAAHHVRRIGVVAYQFQGEVGLDGAREIVDTAGVLIPAAIGLLNGAEVVADEGEMRIVIVAEDESQKDVFGFEDGVALEFAHPVAVGILQAEEAFGGVVDGLLNLQLNGDRKLKFRQRRMTQPSLSGH